MQLPNLAESIHGAALDCGFDYCGIIPIDKMDGYEAYYLKRLKNIPSAGRFYQYRSVKDSYHWAASVVICVFDFGKYRFPGQLRGRYGKAFFLDPEDGKTDGYDVKAFQKWMDAQGIRNERSGVNSLRYAAEAAGLGIIRNNNFFYAETGSYVTLVGFVIDRECQLIFESKLKPCGEHCDICVKSCKTCALSAPHTMDPMKCVSFLTTFGKGVIPPGLCEDMCEQWICGCDNCQDACPYNRRHNWDEGEDFAGLADIAPLLTPEKIADSGDAFLRDVVIPKTSDHLQPTDVEVLRSNARRALRFLNRE